jgi:hypothetical protein
VCRAGASWVRDNILEQQPDANLSVYVVWLPMLSLDSRSAVDTELLADPRVSQFWDEERVVGRWLAESGIGELAHSGIVWDAYYLFGPDAAWNERPAPLAGSGSPVLSTTGQLERQLAPLLR